MSTTMPAPASLGERLLGGLAGERTATISTGEPGIAAGLDLLAAAARAAGIEVVEPRCAAGDRLDAGAAIAALRGSAVELARAEDVVLGDLGVACGVATRADALVTAAPDGLRVVCGGWKKLPAAMKPAVRAGLAASAVAPRLLDGDFVYVDKNAVRLLGGIEAATSAASALGHGPVAIQVKQAADVVGAARAGARAVMVDTGAPDDLAAAHEQLVTAGLRAAVVLGFAGGVTADDLPSIAAAGADVVDVGRAILGAPLLDLRLDVEP